MPRRKYTTEQEIELVAKVAQAGSPYLAAAQTGVPEMTLADVAERHRPILEGLREYNRSYHLNLVRDRALMTLERMTDDAETKAVMHLSIAHGILADKMLLLEGAPTQIHQHLHEHRVELWTLRDKLLAAIPHRGEPQHLVESHRSAVEAIADNQADSDVSTQKQRA